MPEFSEWMMGFPVGWTEGLARSARLRAIGNAVCPPQGVLALRLLAFGSALSGRPTHPSAMSNPGNGQGKRAKETEISAS